MVFFFMRWLFVERYTLFTSDVVQDFAMHHFAASALKLGQIPLWDPYFTGALVGYLNSGIFYPFNLVTDFLHSFSLDNLNFGYLLMQWNAFFHYFLASFFMYLLVRSFKLSRIASIIAAITFAYSGYLVKEYVHLQYLQGGVWLPLVFLFFYKSIFSVSHKIKYAVLSGLFFGISLLSGQTQPAIYYIFALIVFVLFTLFHFYQTKEGNYRQPIFSFLIFALVSFGIFAVQFFPTREYAKYSVRNEVSYGYSIQYSADPLYLAVHPFVPSFWGTMSSRFWDGVNEQTLDFDTKTKWLDGVWGGLPNETTFYLGLLPFFLLPFAFFSKNKFLRDFFLVLLFFSVLLMLSRSIPLVGRTFYYIIGGVARVPVRASFLWSFSLAFLAALGLQAILDFKEEKKEIFEKITKANFFILAALAFFFLPILIGLMLAFAGSPKLPYFYAPIVNSFALFVIYFFVYSLLLFFLIRRKDFSLPLILITIFFVIDLFSFHFENSFIIPSNGSPESLLGKKNLSEIAYLKNDKEAFRVTGLGLTAYANNLSSLGYGSLGSAGFAYRTPLELYSIIKDDASPIYDILNVKYFYAKDGGLRDLVSSVYGSNFMSDHPAYYSFDGKQETEWVVDVKNKTAEKDWLGATFRKPETISRIEFLGRDNDLDKEIKDLELFLDDGSIQKISLPIKEGWKVMDIKPIKTSWIKFGIDDFDLSGGKNNSYGLREINIINSAGEKVEIGSPKFERISNTDLYLNKNALPRVFTTYGYKSFKDRNEMFTAILSDQTGEDMRQNVFLYNKILGFTNPQNPSALPASSSNIKEYKFRKVTVEVNMAADGFLVLADVWFPGWKAFIDGRETNLFSAYHALRAVQVPAGRHTIVFSYDPLSFKVGKSVTIITILVLIAYFLSPLFARKKK